jgi:coenzyme F420-0:L-glutamate ligase / coenzyme F420-1:gamma-L-glutamate ligase
MVGAHQVLPDALLERLEQARVARLATFDVDAGPHLVPVCFASEGQVLYTALDQKAKRVPPERLVRVRNICAEPRVALLIDHFEEDWSRLWYVLIRGTAQLLPPSAHEERGRAIRRLRAKYLQYTPEMLPDDAPLIRIRPERVTSWGKI